MSSYRKLAIVMAINAVVMFLLTYALIDSLDHFHVNINRIYMALMMVAPMVILMVIVMRSMFGNMRLNIALLAGAAAVFLGSFFLARSQTPVGNEQFLRSMIPHHSSAILMCERSSITDPQIVTLCEEIVRAQEREIAEMEAILSGR
ncbi:MAG TPA: DUF305 domain-containing protein [Actinomycetota bacterium]|nr:DUF305 domain-containing protein [Actinomycetota bacterium]